MATDRTSLTAPLWVLALSVAGYLMLDEAGAFLGFLFGLVVGLVARSNDRILSSRMHQLELRMGSLERGLQRLRGEAADPGARDDPSVASARRASPAADFPSQESVPEATETHEPETRPSPGDFTAGVRPPTSGPADPVAPQPSEPRWEQPPGDPSSDAPVPAGPNPIGELVVRAVAFFAGGNPVVRVGVLILLFGIAFLAAYAAERGWVSIELRLATIAAVSIGLLLFGWRLRDRPGAYGLVLQGGAIGALYITVFAAARLYEILPLGLAFVLMVGLVVLSGALALLQDARWLALFGITGGFLAPILVSTGGGSHVALFSYFALLNLGIVGIAWFKAWRELNLVGFLFTFVLATSWGFRYYEPDLFWTTEPFLVLFFLFYLTISVLFALRQAPDLRGFIDATLVFGVPIVAFGLQSPIVEHFEFGLAWSALALALIYVPVAALLWRRSGPELRLLSESFLALGVTFATVAVPLALEGHWTAAVWALEGAAMVWIGVRQSRSIARYAGIFLQLAAGIAFVGQSTGPGTETPILNSFWFGAVLISLASLFVSRYLEIHRDQTSAPERAVEIPLLLWGVAWWIVPGLVEIGSHVDSKHHPNAVIGLFALTGLLISLTAAHLVWGRLAHVGILLTPALFVLLLIQFADPGISSPLEGSGIVAWPLAIATTWYMLRRIEVFWPERLVELWHAAGLWLVTIGATWQLASLIESRLAAASSWSYAIWGLVPSLVLLAILRWGDRLDWPVAAHRDGWYGIGLAGSSGAVSLWFLVAGARTGYAAPLPWMPVLNPVSLTQLFVLLATLRWLAWWHRRDDRAFPAELVVSVAGLGFFYWSSVVVTRTVHMYGDVGWSLEAMFESSVWQSSISILWTIIALSLMVVAARNRSRTAWFAGASLLAVVVAKLFFVDLVEVGTMARIVSFLVVGSLMLVIGYLSPLPPSEVAQEES